MLRVIHEIYEPGNLPSRYVSRSILHMQNAYVLVVFRADFSTAEARTA